MDVTHLLTCGLTVCKKKVDAFAAQTTAVKPGGDSLSNREQSFTVQHVEVSQHRGM